MTGVRSRRWTRLPRALALGLLATTLLPGCEEEVEWSGPPPAEMQKLRNQGKPQAKTPDRLPPGDLLEGPEELFGFSVPRGMKGIQKAPTVAVITGPADFDKLTDYVKDRISARHAEMLEGQFVFPNARIRGTPNKVFTVTVRKLGESATVEIRDITPLPGTHGLSEQERWKRAGMKPSGGLIDPNAME